LWSEFIGLCMHAALQISLRIVYDCSTLVNAHQTSFWPVILLAQPDELETESVTASAAHRWTASASWCMTARILWDAWLIVPNTASLRDLAAAPERERYGQPLRQNGRVTHGRDLLPSRVLWRCGDQLRNYERV